MNVFVLVGESGEYSGHREWIVAAFDDEALARERLSKCDAEVRRLVAVGWVEIVPDLLLCRADKRSEEVDDQLWDPTDPRWPKSEADRKLEMVSAEVQYRIEVVEFVSSLPGGK